MFFSSFFSFGNSDVSTNTLNSSFLGFCKQEIHKPNKNLINFFFVNYIILFENFCLKFDSIQSRKSFNHSTSDISKSFLLLNWYICSSYSMQIFLLNLRQKKVLDWKIIRNMFLFLFLFKIILFQVYNLKFEFCFRHFKMCGALHVAPLHGKINPMKIQVNITKG
jgi:hypothetical protein